MTARTTHGGDRPKTIALSGERSHMTTPLTNTLRREIYVADVAYRVAMTAEGVTLVRKGARKAITHTWEDLLASPHPPSEKLDAHHSNGSFSLSKNW